jgi:HD-GYP domain-containing protein (c-di-GMP phosphodiesterase class II)
MPQGSYYVHLDYYVYGIMDLQPKYKGLQKTQPTDLTVGMYVAQLDREWEETNFPLQGFYIRNQKMIERVESECAYVYVDPRRYDSKLGEVKLRTVVDNGNIRSHAREKLSARERLAPKKPTHYEDSISINDEMPAATTSLEEAEQILSTCVVKLQSNGGFDIKAIENAITPLVRSVMRNQTALAALTRMRRMDDYLFSHAISCSVWGAVLARELGLPPDDVNQVAFTCSLLDIGKTTLPIDLLNSPDKPDDTEWALLKDHVKRGVDLLIENGLTDTRVISAIETHHERHDGSGYPAGLSGNKIPAFGRIAGIVDSYDAMISERPYAKARSSYQAIQEIQTNAGVLYQSELVDYFIKAIGVFPVGSIVELNTGEVGVVVSQTMDSRLKPKVMLILEPDKQPRPHLVIIDLSNQQAASHEPLQWWITKELAASAYGIDPQKYFLD